MRRAKAVGVVRKVVKAVWSSVDAVVGGCLAGLVRGGERRGGYLICQTAFCENRRGFLVDGADFAGLATLINWRRALLLLPRPYSTPTQHRAWRQEYLTPGAPILSNAGLAGGLLRRFHQLQSRGPSVRFLEDGPYVSPPYSPI